MQKPIGNSSETGTCESVASREEIKKLHWTVISKNPQAGYTSLCSGDCTGALKLFPPALGISWVFLGYPICVSEASLTLQGIMLKK